MRSVFLTLLLVLVVCGCTKNQSVDAQSNSVKPVKVVSDSKMLGTVSPECIALSKDSTRPQGVHDNLIELSSTGRGFTYIEPRDGGYRVVHNGSVGKPYKLVGDLTLSRDGKRVAYVAHVNDKFKSIISDGTSGPLLTDIGMPKFTPDGKHLIYTTTMDNDERLVIDHKIRHEFKVGQDVLLSPDSRSIAFAVTASDASSMQFIISDFTLQDMKVFNSCGEAFVSSGDSSRIAVMCSDGAKRTIQIVDFLKRSPVVTYDIPAATGQLVKMRFSANNKSFAFTTMTEDLQRFIYYNGRVERIPKDDEVLSDPLVLADPERVGVIVGSAFKVNFYNAFRNSGYAERTFGYISDFISTGNGQHHAYVAIDSGGEERMRIVVDGNEGPLFDKIVSPLFSPDGNFLVYRARKNEERFLVVSDLKGKIVRQHATYDMVFQPFFSDDGKSVGYGALVGNELWWKVEKL